MTMNMRRALSPLAFRPQPCCFVFSIFVFSWCLFGFTGISADSSALDARIDDLLRRMTLDEKLSMVSGVGFETRPVERLGIPALQMTDGPAGVRAAPATAFPAGIALAASFDPALVHEVGAAIAREAKAKGKNVLLAPTVNIVRAPHSGRNFESFGEDPYLAGRMGVAYIRGVQSEGVIAAVKHYAANNQEIDRHTIDVQVDERTLHEIYLPAFRAAVQEGGSWSVMAAYNRVNGHHATESKFLLTDVLKKQWGFKGFVMSDWDAVKSTVPTLRAGLDLEMPHGTFLNAAAVTKALDEGAVTLADIDDKVRRILRAMGAMGMLADRAAAMSRLTASAKATASPPDLQRRRKAAPTSTGALDTPEHRRIALDAARAGIVLLKNDRSVLPLDRTKIKSIAVIGPNAAVARIGGGGSAKVIPFYAVSPLEGLTKLTGDGVRIDHAPGVIALEDTTPIPAEHLRPPDTAATPAVGQGSSPAGLLGEYFTNLTFEGAPVMRRVEAVNFRWATGSPEEGFPAEGFSVRWSGTLRPPSAGRYVLSLSSNDGGRLYLDDRLVVDVWGDHATLTGTAIVELSTDRPHRVRVEYYEKQGNADIVLGWRRLEGDPRQAAVDAATRADVAVVFAGLSEALETEAKDREDLYLPEAQESLIAAVAAANKNTIVVLNAGGPVLVERWIDSVPALVNAFYLGQEGGTALAEVLFGDRSPVGRLPITFPRRWEDSPAHGRYPGNGGVVRYDEGMFVGYRHFDRAAIEPRYPFGHGLSYTGFEYASAAAHQSDNGFVVEFTIQNTGRRSGSEIAQVYVRRPQSIVPLPPVRELKAFRKVTLEPGARQRVAIDLPREAFAHYDPRRRAWIVVPGRVQFQVGSSSSVIRLAVDAEIR